MELMDWEKQSQQQFEEYEELYWESDAREAVELVLIDAIWDANTGVVSIFANSKNRKTEVKFSNREELESYLVEISSVAFCCGAPFENGEYVFETDSFDVVDYVLIDFEEKLDAVFGK